MEEEGFRALAISLYHGEIAGGLPLHHKDPFDRMLIAQAKVLAMQLVTNDSQMCKYDVQIIDPLQ